MNLQKLIKEAQKAQRKAAEAQERLTRATVQGVAGGGLVEVTASGTGTILGIKLKPKAVDPGDLEALEDLLLVAIQDAQNKASELTEKEMGQELGGMSQMLGGMF